MKALIAAILCVATVAAAEPMRPQHQADLGLSVIGLGHERPVSAHVAVGGELGIFGTYFLPWFDLGHDLIGLQLGARVTWFKDTDGRGLYVAPYVRGVAARGENDGTRGEGLGFTAGAFVGWAFRLSRHVNLRVGAGAQYIYFDVQPVSSTTPFVALDALVGYRL